MNVERRSVLTPLQMAMIRELNMAQRMTLSGLEKFGWELKFIRRQAGKAPVAVVFDSDRKSFAVLEEDGELNENPGFPIRG